MRPLKPLRGAVVALALAFFSACSAAPAASPSREFRTPADVLLPVEALIVRGVVPPRTTLDALLRGHGVEAEAVMRVVEASRHVFDPRHLRSTQPYEIERTVLGALRRFEYEMDEDRFLRVTDLAPGAAEMKAEVVPIPKTRESAVAAAAITTEAPSLFAAMKEAGQGPELAIALASIFSGDVDFNSEVQLGDRLAVVFDRVVREGRAATYGEIRAAQFVNEGRVLHAVLFAPPGAKPGYYDEQGRSLKRFFLKSPLKFEPRVTSGFSLRRMHPVLHTARAHRGVDYAAGYGAPVVAVAPGTVVSASYDDTNGRMVRLRHASGYETHYLHLSGFARGIRAGLRVDQSDVIGYVGSSGLSTGTHLHYGLTKNGAYVNPIVEHRRMPPGEPIPPEAMAAFHIVRDKALADLASVASRLR